VNRKIKRYFLEIKSFQDLKEIKNNSDNYYIKILGPKDFQLNKFFYKNIGKKHEWLDRLNWTEKKWIEYVSNNNVSTYILKNKNDLVGYFEFILHDNKKETEIAYFGILEEYFGKKLGGYLLSYAIKESFLKGSKRIWVHTCNLDHENALKNYLARGMKIFKTETITR
tara:strand:- start:587 stop:1090 length:504 start_codon:yes stop_codon:yes gene_type:complete